MASPSQAHPPSALSVKSPSEPPQSPVATSREQERVTILLQINGELLKEASNLHTQGKGGLMAQPQKSEDGKDGPQPSSREWIEYV